MSPQKAKDPTLRDGKGRAMFSVEDLAQRFDCSPKHVRRMAETGRIPPPIKLGNLVRWRVGAIEQWESEGCPNYRNASKKARPS